MGRWTDKPYISQGEHADAHGTSKTPSRTTSTSRAFNVCALSLKPLTNPVCSPDGVVFESSAIKKYLKENSNNPITGEPLQSHMLIALVFHKNSTGEYIDPVSFKQLTEHTKVVANKVSGNVYAWSTVLQFNIKAQNWNDLVNGEKFTKDDLIIIQEPATIANDLIVSQRSTATKDTKKHDIPPIAKDTQKHKSTTARNTSNHSTGLAAAAFTSTSLAPITHNESATIDDESYMLRHITKKSYIQLVTNLGTLNIELHSDKTPRTCFNFIQLARTHYYDNTKFHRSIKHFMIQGGDPTSTGHGGSSYWKTPFEDEFVPSLSHSSRGILSMANRGSNTNTSQFFVLFRRAPHLDGKHTVFGRVVGGLDVLDKMEAVPTDDSDHPKSDIVIQTAKIVSDAFADFVKRRDRKSEHERRAQELVTGKRAMTHEEAMQRDRDTMTWFGNSVGKRAREDSELTGGASSKGVGKYMKKPEFVGKARKKETGHKKETGYKFGDFSEW